MIDTHCHLNLAPLSDDISSFINSASAVGIDQIIVPGVSIESSLYAVEVSKKYPFVFSAVGVHPLEDGEASLVEIEKLLQNEPTIVAVGEIGFDLSDGVHSLDLQRSRFEQQVLLAKLYDKPLIIHSRDAYTETAAVLRALNYGRAVIHCFTGSYEQARVFLDLGCLISVTGIITYKSADDLRKVIGSIPINRLMLETDAPYLAPNTQRGRVNQPAFLLEIARALAAIHGVGVDEVESCTTTTAKLFFSLNNV